MNLPAASLNKPRVGTCPHGLPLGACPVCNGMGGGGGSTKKTDKPTSEMTYDQCYAIWQQMLKAKELAQQKKNDAMQAQMQNVPFTARLENIAQKIANLIEKLADFAQKPQNSSLPKIIAKPLALAAKIAIPILNILKNIPILAQKTVNFVQQKMADISDKLNAIFGELKNSTEKKISEALKNFKKKFKSLFGIYETTQVEDEEKRIEESKRTFELKTILHSIKERFNKNEQKE